MLEDYIKQYQEAITKGDKKAMQRIERDLRKLGMDYATLRSLISYKGR